MASTPIDFILNNFDTDITLDVCGNFAGVLYSMTASAEAIIEVDLALVKEAFQFQSDASDVLNGPASDLKYYVKSDSFWLANFNRNAADAAVQPTISSSITTGPIASGYDVDKSFVCHDFVRFLAEGLFNTHHGVDLLDNEEELLHDIRDNAREVWDTMNLELTKYNDVDGTGMAGSLNVDGVGAYYSNDVESENLTKKLYEQMIYTLSGKQRFIVGPTTISDSGLRQPLPFQEGDSISLKLNVSPAAGQEDLTGVANFGSRSYRIKYVLKASPVNVGRSNTEIVGYELRP